MSDTGLVGRIAVVTGGGRGMGRGICKVFARQGAQVVVVDIQPETAEETLKELKGTGSGHCALCIDVGDRTSVVRLFDAIKQRYGRAPDAVVNCAGIGRPVNFLNTTDEDYDALTHVNLKGVFLMTQEACKRMIADGIKGGSIVNISSMSATTAQARLTVYAATKGGVESFTRTVALEMAPYGIRANVVSPGTTDTPMMRGYFNDKPEELRIHVKSIPLGRVGQPEDLGEACAYLASTKSSYVTGATLQVAGGRHMGTVEG